MEIDEALRKAKLWDAMKAELEAESEHTWKATKNDGYVYTVGDVKKAKEAKIFLDRMLKAEIFAMAREFPNHD